MRKILILGGTKEAVILAQILVEEGNQVITSLAGRTKEPTVPVGETRVGGFGGAEVRTIFQDEAETQREVMSLAHGLIRPDCRSWRGQFEGRFDTTNFLFLKLQPSY